jgi:hypothetical protein
MTYAHSLRHIFLKRGEEIEVVLDGEPVKVSYKGEDLWLLGSMVAKHVNKEPVFDGNYWALCAGAYCKHCVKYKNNPYMEVQDIPVIKTGKYGEEKAYLMLALTGYFPISHALEVQKAKTLICQGMKLRIKRLEFGKWEVEVLDAPTEVDTSTPKAAIFLLDLKEKSDIEALMKQVEALGLSKLPSKEEYIQVLVDGDFAWPLARATQVVNIIFNDGKLEGDKR